MNVQVFALILSFWFCTSILAETAKERLEIKKIAAQKLRQKYSALNSRCAPVRQGIHRLDYQGCPNGQCAQKGQQNSLEQEIRIMNKMRDLQTYKFGKGQGYGQ